MMPRASCSRAADAGLEQVPDRVPRAVRGYSGDRARLMRFGFGGKLGAIAALAFTLRLLGTEWGKPYAYHFDEPFVLKPALRIVESGDLNPHFFRYPSLLIYLESVVVRANNSLGNMPLNVPNDPSYGPQDLYPETWPALYGGRHLVAAFGTLGIVAVALVARATGGATAGLFAALALAVFPLHVEHSHYLTTDVPAATFLTFALAALLSVSGWLGTTLAGITAGFAISTKYTAGAVLPILVLFIAAETRGHPRVLLSRLVLLLFAAVTAFAATSPYAFMDTRTFLSDVGIVKEHYTSGHLGAEGTGNWEWYLTRLYQDGLGGVGLALLGLGCLLVVWDAARRSAPVNVDQGKQVRGPLVALALLAAAVIWFCWLGSVRVRFERNLLPAMVLACTAASHGWASLLDALRGRKPIVASMVGALLLVVLLAPARIASGIITNLRAPDTRAVATQWIQRNLKQGSSIVREEYTPQPDGDRYRVRYVWSLAVQDASDYARNGVEYLVASQAIYARILNDSGPQMRAMAERYRHVFVFPKVASFVPGHDMSGPAIDIFAVPQAGDQSEE
jgi:hypothetical protein